MILVQDDEFILAEYKKTFAEGEEPFPLRHTYWLGCYSADAAPVIENPPPAPFGLIVETPGDGDLHQLWYGAFKDLIRTGVTDFNAYGWRAEELHDHFDWALAELDTLGGAYELEDDAVLMTTGNAGLPEAIETHEVVSHFLEPSNCVVLRLCLDGGEPS